jgi:hypothetical protein
MPPLESPGHARQSNPEDLGLRLREPRWWCVKRGQMGLGSAPKIRRYFNFGSMVQQWRVLYCMRSQANEKFTSRWLVASLKTRWRDACARGDVMTVGSWTLKQKITEDTGTTSFEAPTSEK